MQGVIKAYDPIDGGGVVIRDTDLAEFELAPGAIEGSIFRMLRQGQRVIFELEGDLAVRISIGAEIDMGTKGFPARPPAE